MWTAAPKGRARVSSRRRSDGPWTARLLLAAAACVAALLLYTLLRLMRSAVHLASPSAVPAFCARPPPFICAHGGLTRDGGGQLANTAPAYSKALLHPAVSCVEVDVARTRDSKLVALHTRQLLRLTDGEHVAVGEARLSELRAAGERKGELYSPLTLREALAALANKGLRAVILDVKDGLLDELGSSEAFAQGLVEEVRAAGCEECILWAKEDEMVRRFMELGTGAERGVRRAGGEKKGGPPSRVRSGFVLMNETAAARQAGMHRLRLAGADVVASHWAMGDAALVAGAAKRGLDVFGWTANEEDMADALIRGGVAAIVTDEPDMVARRLAELRAPCRDDARRDG